MVTNDRFNDTFNPDGVSPKSSVSVTWGELQEIRLNLQRAASMMECVFWALDIDAIGKWAVDGAGNFVNTALSGVLDCMKPSRVFVDGQAQE